MNAVISRADKDGCVGMGNPKAAAKAQEEAQVVADADKARLEEEIKAKANEEAKAVEEAAIVEGRL